MSPLPSARRPSLTAQVARDLQDRIDGGELRPGDRLPTEFALMAEFGVSRTVVREAISSLRAAGRIETQQGRGAFVLAPPAGPRYRLAAAERATAEDVLGFMEVRIALEAEAAALAAQRRSPAALVRLTEAQARFAEAAATPDSTPAHDMDFHMAIAEATGNPHFTALFDGFSAAMLPRLRLDLFKDDLAGKADYARRLCVEHDRILDAIRDANPDAARAAARQHLGNSRERLVSALAALGEGQG